MPSGQDDDEDDEWQDMTAPFGRDFPGLAPAESRALDQSQVAAALAGLPIAAVLRSWEERFGATLLQVGFARIRLLAQRPPSTPETARLLAAEHFAFCDECAGQGLHQVTEISQHLLQSPIWTFWWD